MTENPYIRPEPHVSDFNVPVVEEFRANGGRVGGMFEGGDLLLLTTVGARSGREHTTPLGYVRVEDRLLVVGSAGGSDRHPAWYHNILAHPMVTVELGTEEFSAVAVPAEGAERNRLFDEIARRVPGYGDYQAGTGRILPVVALERADAESTEVANLADKLLQVHTWLRGQLGHVRTEVEAHLAERASRSGADGPPPPGINLQLRQHCLAFCESLHFHHTGEELMFPHLEEREPHLARTLDRLREEHRTVERLRGELEALIADLAGTDPERLREEVDRMATELEAHLDYEEAELFPTLAAIPLPPDAPA
ncbi:MULTISPECIES: nitroreductase/quinone reductase family protein [Nocardiopsis]|uniref:Cation-binding protein n=1 Tax=Nocardiopsis sinuspersici TaxID=501010 RepID=A0A1V3BXN3_9ACTN|nr:MULTISPECIES: nitroreductase/quinone reductase family protein [Nocardiopsis]OOC52870.1 cation-binding protein [Nocardiopsis sinuspersici]